MQVIRITESISSGSLHVYHLDRGGVRYWATAHKDGTMSLSQRYTKRNGTAGSRAARSDALLAEAVAAIGASLRERLCTPVTVAEAGAALALA